MMLSEHFSQEELTASETAARAGVDNTPSGNIVANLIVLASGLERVRAILGNTPIHVNSGYRCPRLNQMIGGAKDSMHLRGLAADILVPSYGTPLEVCKAIAEAKLDTDQVIHEFGLWCHVAFPQIGTEPRNELLTILSAAKGYEVGLLSA